MDPANQAVLEEFLQAYGKVPRPAVYGDPDHCERAALHAVLVHMHRCGHASNLRVRRPLRQALDSTRAETSEIAKD